jgi:transposase
MQGVENLVVDSSSIKVNRRKRRTKTDRLDAAKLVTMLIRWNEGEKTVWSVVHVPSDRPRMIATLSVSSPP